MNIINEMKTSINEVVVKKYVEFEGRASRPEYWWFALATFILSILVSIILFKAPMTASAINGLISLALLVPSIGVGIRRLHDIGKSGWWLLIALIPFVGAIIAIYWLAQPSQEGDNQYGPRPKWEVEE